VEETEGWNEHTSPCIGIELANLRLDIRLPLAYIFNANLLTDIPPGGFILGFLKPTEILLNVA
jgi:hypothetical protein